MRCSVQAVCAVLLLTVCSRVVSGVQPKVSVVLPVYNGMPYLPTAIDSVLQQTHGHLELIVVNDGSTDGTAAYLARLSDSRVRVVSLPSNRRLPNALNVGFRAATAQWLTWVSADCWMQEQMLDRLLKVAVIADGGRECRWWL